MSVAIASPNKDLQVLLQELSKTNPDLKLLKFKTESLGIPFSSDLITLMSEVLVYLSKSQPHKNRLKEKNT